MRDRLQLFLRWQVAALSTGAAAIHFSETSTHFEEYWVFGAFFFVVAWFQAASAVAIVTRTDRRLVLALVGVNVVTVAIWIWSRTAGLPIGPEAGTAEEIGAADLLATVLESVLVVWAFAVLLPAVASRSASRGLGVLTTAIVWASVVGMTALVFFNESSGTMGH